MKLLISGWFSFENMGTTAGDIIACRLICDWLKKADLSYELASKQKTLKGINWKEANPDHFSHVIFLCGPFGNGWPVTDFIDHFKNSKLIGMNLSMLQSLNDWNPFDLLIERDSDHKLNPDITFGAQLQKVPVVGIIKVHKQKEYGSLAKHEIANKAIDNLVASREMAQINVDTALEDNLYGLRSANAIESLIAKTDVVITTRLHGLALSLKNGVPAIAIDPISGGAKISRQAKSVNWPYCFKVDNLKLPELNEAFEACLTKKTITLANLSAEKGKKKVLEIEGKLSTYLLEQKKQEQKLHE